MVPMREVESSDGHSLVDQRFQGVQIVGLGTNSTNDLTVAPGCSLHIICARNSQRSSFGDRVGSIALKFPSRLATRKH